MKTLTLNLSAKSNLHLWSPIPRGEGINTSPIQLIMLGLIKGKWTAREQGSVLIKGEDYAIEITNEKLTLVLQEQPSAKEKGKDNASM
jgi:hypothetical protein